MRPSRDEYFALMSWLASMRGTCLRRRVGCVLVDVRGHVLSTGYNGVAAGRPHCNEVTNFRRAGLPTDGYLEPVHGNACAGAGAASGTNLDACGAIHAEQNALLQCRDVHAIDTAYVTASPCVTCIKLLLNTSCKRIVFLEEYPHGESKSLWEGSGREWCKYDGRSFTTPEFRDARV